VGDGVRKRRISPTYMTILGILRGAFEQERELWLIKDI